MCLRMVLLICMLSFSSAFTQDNPKNDKANEKPFVYCVFLHTPGPSWQPGTPFQEQSGVEEHVQYMRQLFEKDLMVMGGPFLDDSGGIMVYNGSDIEKAKELAHADPAVQTGLLNVEVKLWMVPMSSVQRIPKN